MNTLAILYMMFDTILGESPPDSLRRHCEELRQSLHVRDPMPDYFPQIEEMTTVGTGELASFLSSYVTQVEALRHLICATRQND